MEFWNVGVGPSVSILNQDGDDNHEIGTGLALSLFGDLVVGGCGYNWTAKCPYWYVGWRFRL
jgi:hypothetical protein